MACTPSTLTGIALDCGNVGGIQKIYIANVADVSSIAFDVEGEVSAMTMAVGKTFKTYDFRKGNASFVSSGTRDDKNGTYFAKTDVSVQFNKMEKSKRTEMIQLLATNAYVIIKDNNGIYWFVGKDSYVSITTGNGQSGATMAEGNFYNLVLSSETAELPNTILPTVISITIVDKM